jgi:hypothetical protein
MASDQGRLAQLGEHQLDKLGVTGSSPVPPIKRNPRRDGGFSVSEVGGSFRSWPILGLKRYGAPTWSFLLSLNRFHGHAPSISTSSEKLSRIRIRTMIPSTVTLWNV